MTARCADAGACVYGMRRSDMEAGPDTASACYSVLCWRTVDVGPRPAPGTLCVLDHRPRRLPDEQLAGLRVLRGAVVTQLELRGALRELDALHRVLVCAWCRRVRRADGAWCPLNEYGAGAVHVSHGVCPGCEESLTREDGRNEF
jgi:hypothetical protein